METGRVINRRYLLKRLIKQGQVCTVYQGVDQVLQRVVAVKAVPSPDIPAYRTAIKMTAHLSHPNIVGLYDLIAEPETLYIVQEYVQGNEFADLLQKPLTPYEVVNLGCQICQALIYAHDASPSVSHGDLTPTAIIRDDTGLVHINNFALPSDIDYFEKWSMLGGDAPALSDTNLPWGESSVGRRADDTRAVGLLLYQLLTIRPAGTRIVEPSSDGRLHFPRSVPPEVCETVARAVARHHPRYISSPDMLYDELKMLADALEPDSLASVSTGNTIQEEEGLNLRQFSPSGAGRHEATLSLRDTENPGYGVSSYRQGQGAGVILPPQEAIHVGPASPTVADVPVPVQFAPPRQTPFPEPPLPAEAPRSSVVPLMIGLLLLGLLLFVLFFAVGYFAGHLLIPGT